MDRSGDNDLAAGQRGQPTADGSRSPGLSTLNRRDSGVDLRASDAERDLAADELGEHFQAGRLDQAEFDERVTDALRARTRRDLTRLLADLPARQQPPSAPAQPAAAHRLFPLLIPLLFVTIVAIGFAGGGGPQHHWGGAGPWPLLWLWWVIPIVVFRMRHSRGRRQLP